MEFSTIRLKPGKSKIIDRKHPWIFSGALEKVSEEIPSGATVRVLDQHGQFQAWAAYSPASQIRARVWSWDEGAEIGPDFFRERIKASLALRQELIARGTTDSYRLVYSESDRLPGLVVDQYGMVLIVQLATAGAEYWRNELMDILQDLLQPAAIYERSDVDVRGLEGLEPRTGLIAGTPLDGDLIVEENGVQFRVDVEEGHKTGFYLDQRQNRQLIRGIANGRQVLDCFSYSGGFAINACLGGAASVTAVDNSYPALELARGNAKLNGIADDAIEWVQADVFQFLRTERDRAHQYDLIVLDPPKFAPTASHVRKAARGYKDINLHAMKLLRPGGILVTFSCSGGLKAELFQKIVADAAIDAGMDGKIIRWLHQAEDHPVALPFPEGEYLKGLVIRKE